MQNLSSLFNLGLEPFESWWLSDDTALLIGAGDIAIAGDGQIVSGVAGTGDGQIAAQGDGSIVSGVLGSGVGTLDSTIQGDGTIVLMSILNGDGQITIQGDGIIAVVPLMTGDGNISVSGDGIISVVPQLTGDSDLGVVIVGDGVISIVPQVDGVGEIGITGDGVISIIPQMIGDGNLGAVGDGIIYSGVATTPSSSTLDLLITGDGAIFSGVTLNGSGIVDAAINGNGVASIIPQLTGSGALDVSITGDGIASIIPQLTGAGTLDAGITGSGSATRGVAMSGTGRINVTFSADNADVPMRTDFFLMEGLPSTSLDVSLSGSGTIYRGVKIFDTQFDIPLTTNIPEIAAGNFANGIPQPALPVVAEVCNSPLSESLFKPLVGQVVKIIQDIPEELAVIPPVITTLPTYTGTTATIPLPAAVEDIPTVVTIAGLTYTLYGGQVVITGGIPDIPANTFIYNPSTSGTPSITVSLPPGNLPPVSAQVIIPPPVFLPTNYVAPPYPDLFGRFPIKGQFSWSLSFEGHPSASFNFITYAQYREPLLAQFTEGTEFTAFGIGYRVTSLSLKESMASTNPQRLIEVNVSLGGRHEVWIDRQVRLQGGNTQNSVASSGLDPNCLILNGNTQGGGSGVNASAKTSLAAIATSARGAYCGPNAEVKIPPSTPSNATTTFTNELRSRVRTMGNGSFVDYNNSGCVEVKGIDSVSQYILAEGRLLSEIQTNLSGAMGARIFGGGNFHPRPDGTVLPSSPLPFPVPTVLPENTTLYKWVKLYDPPYKLEWGDVPDGGDSAKSEDTQLGNEYTVPEWKQRKRVKAVTEEGDTPVNEPPANSSYIKDVSVCFDLSGPRKTYKKTTTLDGLPLEDYVEEWGFVVYGWQLYNDADMLTGANSAALWQQIRVSTTKYFYDPDTGYQLGYDTDGWELARYKQENASDPETAKLEATGDNTEFNLYIFFQNPSRVKQRNYLEPMRDYYKDIEIDTQINYKVCLPGGRSEWRFEVDPTFVEPYMVLYETMHTNSLAWIPNPLEGDGDKPLPPLTCGKEEFHRRSVMILNSKNTQFPKGFRSPGIYSALGAKSFYQESPETLNSKEGDRYREYSAKFSSQDSQFANSLQDTSFILKEGRPPIATKLPPLWEKVEPEEKNGKDDAAAAKKEKEAYDYFVRSGIDDYYGDKTFMEGGSLSYPHAKSLSEALIGARTDAIIENWNGGTKENFTVPFTVAYRPGDKLIYNCNYSTRQRRILSINNTVNIDGFGGITVLTAPNSGTQLGVGIDRPFPMDNFRKVRQPEKGQDQEKVITSRVFLGSYPLGEIIGEGIITRRNLP